MLLRPRVVGEQREHLSDHLSQGRLIAALRWWGRFAGLAPALLLCGAAALAQSPDAKFSLDVGVGREELSSPVIRISPNGPLVLVDGLNRLSGNYVRTTAGGMRDWPIGGDGHFMLSGRADWKRAPSAPDLDFGMVSADAMFRWPVAGFIAGIGPNVQRLWIAGARFRDATGAQADLVKPTPGGGYWAWLAGIASNRHGSEFVDLNSRAAAVSVHRRIAGPLPGLDALDLEFGLGRERNANGLDDLSSRNAFGRLSIDRRLAGVDFSVGVMIQRARFDAAFLDDFPARRDRFRLLDFAATLDLGKGRGLRLEAASGHNASNLPLFENRYRQISLTFSISR